MAAPPTPARVRERCIAAAVLVGALGGCGLGADRPPTIRAAEIARGLQSATGIPLRAVRPPFGLPGVPELATTLSGGTTYESLTVFVFFEPAGTKRVLGGDRRPAGMTVLTRSNVVVLYRRSAQAGDKSRQLRRALKAVIAGS
jgi:hypothetical protein